MTKDDAGKFVRDQLWEVLNIVGYSARGELIAAPKKVCNLVNRIGNKWVESLTGKPEQHQEIRHAIEEVGSTRSECVEGLCSNFVKQTGADPKDCVLVQQIDGDKVRFWVELRREGVE